VLVADFLKLKLMLLTFRPLYYSILYLGDYYLRPYFESVEVEVEMVDLEGD